MRKIWGIKMRDEMEIQELERKHQSGVQLLKERGYFERILPEIRLLIKYVDNQFFLDLFSQNLLDDMRGVFRSFVRQDLYHVFREMQEYPTFSLTELLERDYPNLMVLKKCTTNLRYQVKSLVRMPQVLDLEFKSSFLQAVSRKLNGEIQELYRLLSENYKQYFRLQFSMPRKHESKVSMRCIQNLEKNFSEYFLNIMDRFYQLADAIQFVRELFKLEMENEIRNRIAMIYFERQERLEQVIDYFINEVKRNFIRTLDRHLRSGREYDWVARGLQKFIYSPRFEKMLQRLIFQTLAALRREQEVVRHPDIF